MYTVDPCLTNMKYKANGMVIEYLTVNTKPKLGKHKPQSTFHNTGDMYLQSSWATWNTKLMGMVIEHLTLNTKPKLSKYKPQNIGKPNLREIKSTSYNTGGMYLWFFERRKSHPRITLLITYISIKIYIPYHLSFIPYQIKTKP